MKNSMKYVLMLLLALVTFLPVSAKKQVYISSSSAYYHKDKKCKALAGGKDIKLVLKKEAKNMGKKKCPTCHQNKNKGNKKTKGNSKKSNKDSKKK